MVSNMNTRQQVFTNLPVSIFNRECIRTRKSEKIYISLLLSLLLYFRFFKEHRWLLCTCLGTSFMSHFGCLAALKNFQNMLMIYWCLFLISKWKLFVRYRCNCHSNTVHEVGGNGEGTTLQDEEWKLRCVWYYQPSTSTTNGSLTSIFPLFTITHSVYGIFLSFVSWSSMVWTTVWRVGKRDTYLWHIMAGIRSLCNLYY